MSSGHIPCPFDELPRRCRRSASTNADYSIQRADWALFHNAQPLVDLGYINHFFCIISNDDNLLVIVQDSVLPLKKLSLHSRACRLALLFSILPTKAALLTQYSCCPAISCDGQVTVIPRNCSSLPLPIWALKMPRFARSPIQL